MSVGSPEFWIALMQIIGVNIVLSGDNAVVIALAARGLPAHQQKKAVAWGSGAAVLMRIVLTLVALELLKLPYLKLIGAALLLWIALQLLLPEEGEEGSGTAVGGMAAAIKTILIADLVMSLDNVIGVAAAAKDNTLLLILGLAISIPLVIFASRLLLVLMERFPIIITIGAALLGWVAGDMAVTDPVVKTWVDAQAPYLHWLAPALGAICVVLVGKWLSSRRTANVAAAQAARPKPAVEMTPPGLQRVLLAVDGSEGAMKAVRYVIGLRDDLRDPASLDVRLLSVQRPLSGDVNRFLSGKTLDDYHREQCEAALAPARAALAAAGIAHQEERRTGEPGPTIADAAQELACDMVVVGAQGLSASASVLLGSVAQSAIEHSVMPVLVVK